jgi:hypothetical protein
MQHRHSNYAGFGGDRSMRLTTRHSSRRGQIASVRGKVYQVGSTKSGSITFIGLRGIRPQKIYRHRPG